MRRLEVFWMLSFPHDKLDTSRLGVAFVDLFWDAGAMWALMWYIRPPESSGVLSTTSTNRGCRDDHVPIDLNLVNRRNYPLLNL